MVRRATSQIIGSYFSDATGTGHSFLYSGGTFTTLDDPLATANGTFVAGINNAGQIVGTYSDSANHLHGYVLTIAPNAPPPPD